MASPLMSGGPLDDMTDAYFSDDADFNAIHVSKRRRSEDSTVNSISSRLESRLPSLSRRWKGRRISGLSMKTRSISSRTPSMDRSTSQSHSARQSREHIASNYPLTPSQSYVQFPDYSVPSSPIDIVHQEVEIKEEPIDREGLASTPLLPPTMMILRAPENIPMQSPLQSPTVVDSGHFSFSNSPAGTPRMNFGPPTPPLSKQPSYSSLAIAARNGPSASLAEIPQLDEMQDEWSEKLGHANFTIEPVPYLPEVCDAFSCRQLFRDWEQARCNFAKHQMRTAEHVGATSTTYKYSEQKWAQIDAKWKAYHDIAFSKAGITDEQITDSSPIEPAPLVRLPSLNSKFPSKGDEDIVGPMEVAPPQVQPRQPRKSSFAKFLSFFGKSPSQ